VEIFQDDVTRHLSSSVSFIATAVVAPVRVVLMTCSPMYRYILGPLNSPDSARYILHPTYHSIYRAYTIQHTEPHFASNNKHLKSILVALDLS
jgi:hypothetical protein